jgi:hypothetical protein
MRSVQSLIVLCLLFLLFSCGIPLPGNDSGEGGSLTISVLPSGVGNRTILPDIDMNIAGYVVSGTGPDGASFQVETDGPSVTVNKLAFGDWQVTVEARNDDGIVIGSGSGSTMVHTGESSSVAVTVTPLEGYGTLDLTVAWNAADTDIPQIDAVLMPPAGAEQPLAFTISGGDTGTYHNEMIPVGYYTVVVRLLDNGERTMGAVEVVRVVKDGVSAGSFDFSEINKPGGSIIVGITPEMADPLTVSIGGLNPELPEGQSMTVTAGVAEDAGNVVYVWYLNGGSVGEGETLTIGSGLGIGPYNLAVTAITTDGTRAGSADAEFHVVETPVP